MNLPRRHTGKSSGVFDAFMYLWIIHTHSAPGIHLGTERQRCLVSFSVKTILALAANMRESCKLFKAMSDCYPPWLLSQTQQAKSEHENFPRRSTGFSRACIQENSPALNYTGVKCSPSQVTVRKMEVFLDGINNEMDGFCVSQIHSPGPHLIS